MVRMRAHKERRRLPAKPRGSAAVLLPFRTKLEERRRTVAFRPRDYPYQRPEIDDTTEGRPGQYLLARGRFYLTRTRWEIAGTAQVTPPLPYL